MVIIQSLLETDRDVRFGAFAVFVLPPLPPLDEWYTAPRLSNYSWDRELRLSSCIRVSRLNLR